jgi:DNA-binding protein
LAEPDKAKISVTLDGSLVLGADYTIEYYDDYYGQSREYVKHFSKVVFLGNAPAAGQTLTVTYTKNIDLLNAVDRIVNYYTATSGMPGLDLGQLMTGIVYPRTRVQGLMLDYTTHWDLDVFGQSAWADDIGYYSTVVSTSTSQAVNTWTSIAINTTTGLAIGQYVNVISTTTNPFTSNNVQVVKIDVPTKTVTFNTTTLSTIANT